MKKVFFVLATIFTVAYLVVIFPAFVYNNSYFVRKYTATEREQTIIADVHDRVSMATTIALWGLIGNYLLFAGAMWCSRKRPNEQG